jgi:gas vesicle protein
MSLDLNLSNEEIKDKINAYKTVSDVYQNNKLRKKVSKTGDNLSEFRDETKTNLSELKEDSQEKINRVKEDVKNQYEELIDFFKTSVQERRDSFNENETVRKVKDLKDSNTVDFLIRQILGAANNTKSRITDIVVDEIIKTAGCSEEQTFEPNETGGNRDNKIHIKVKQIDLFKILDKNPSEGFNSLLYEKESRNNGIYPYPMNKELFSRLQLEGSSFYDEFNEDYVGDSGNGIMDIKYVTSYTEDGITYNGDFLEVTLTSRPTVNSISDFLRDYYKSIDILEFDTLGTKIINSLTNVVDLSINVTSSEKTEQNKFEKIIQRVLGLCFDGRKEIDVSGNAKTPVLDNIDDSFFEMTPVDLRIIENEVNNYLDGVTEFKDCGNVKLPVNVDLTCQKLQDLREVEESKKIDALINIIESLPEQDNWKLFLPDGINVDLSIKNGLLKIIPRSVITSILSPKTLLGLMIALKSVGSVRIDLIEDFKTFSENLKEFMVELISKIGAIFIEELFKLLKRLKILN